MREIKFTVNDGEGTIVEAAVSVRGADGAGFWGMTVVTSATGDYVDTRQRIAHVTVQQTGDAEALVQIIEERADRKISMPLAHFVEQGAEVLDRIADWIPLGDPLTDCIIKTGLSVGVRRAWDCGKVARNHISQMRTLEVFFQCVRADPMGLASAAGARFMRCVAKSM